jgi:surface protein
MAYAHRAKNTYAALPFISTWKTDNLSTGSSTNTQVKLPLVSTGTYKFTVNWGDGNTDVITTWNQAQVTHTYAAIGTYTITITGFIKGWEFNNLGDRLKIMKLDQWGCLRLGNDMPPLDFNRGFFFGCENITYTNTTDILNLKGVTNVGGLFRRNYQTTKINNIEKLDVSKITNANNMFANCVRWDGDVSYFNTSNITTMYNMLGGQSAVFPHGSFTNMGNPDIGNWDTSKVTSMLIMFGSQYKFNQNIGNWDVSNVTEMNSMFAIQPSPFVLPAGIGTFNNGGSDSIKNWNTSKVTVMNGMFQQQSFFNQPIGSWDMSNVTNTSFMFSGYATPGIFNQDISKWNTSKVTLANNMFVRQINFNQDINTKTVTVNGNTYTAWDMSKVTTIGSMLGRCTNFNQPLNNWDTSKVTNMQSVFQESFSFNQPIDNWNVSLVTNFSNFMLSKTNLDYSAANYDALLIGWASRPVKPNISINFGTIKYTAAASAARAILTSAPNNWTIVDGGI